MFIIVNQHPRVQVQIILLLYAATANVLEPMRYNGNINLISGPGEVKVNKYEPAIVTDTENISR